MKRDSKVLRFKVRRARFKINPPTLFFRGVLLVITLLTVFSLVLGGQEKEKAQPTTPFAQKKGSKPGPAPTGEQRAPKTPAPTRTQGLTFHSILTKDLNRLIPATSFSINDRIYLYTVWTGLQGPHEIKVLWIRPDKTVQETVRLKENVPSQMPTFTSWAYLSFTKGLLNISPQEGKFIGAWKAQLFLDGKFLKELDFTVF